MGLIFVSTNILLLLAGIVLSIITIRRMVTGAISLPLWAKVLLIISMVLMNLILILSITPPLQVEVDHGPAESVALPDPSKSIQAAP